MRYRQLTHAQRRTIVRLLNAKMPVDEIASRLGRHRSTNWTPPKTLALSCPI